MTTNNHFKELVRARMADTDEPYSVAARNIRNTLSFQLSQFENTPPALTSVYRDKLFTSPVKGTPNLNYLVGLSKENTPVSFKYSPSLFIGGISGNGKSNLLSSIISQLAHNNDVADVQLWCISTKEDIGLSVHTGHVTRSVSTPKTAAVDFIDASIRLLDDAVDEIRQRLIVMEKAGVTSISPGTNTPYLFVIIDEVAALFRDVRGDAIAAAINMIIRQGRASGVFVIVTSQLSTLVGDTRVVEVNDIPHIVFRTYDRAQSYILTTEGGMEKASRYVGAIIEGNKDTVVFRSFDT